MAKQTYKDFMESIKESKHSNINLDKAKPAARKTADKIRRDGLLPDISPANFTRITNAIEDAILSAVHDNTRVPIRKEAKEVYDEIFGTIHFKQNKDLRIKAAGDRLVFLLKDRGDVPQDLDDTSTINMGIHIHKAMRAVVEEILGRKL